MADQPVPALTPAGFAVLLALHDAQRHGYGLMADVARLTGDTIRLGPGTLYRTLQRLRVDGLIEEIEVADVQPRGDRRAERRRSYRLTSDGRAAAAAEAQRLAVLVDAAGRLGLVDRGE